MYFGKITIFLVIAACVAIDAGALKRKSIKPKIKKPSLPKIVSPQCGYQNTIAEIINCGCGPAIDPILGALGSLEIGLPGCQGAIIEPTLAPLAFGYPGYRPAVIEPALGTVAGCVTPIIDIPHYRYADPLELKSLAPLFPAVEISNPGFHAAQLALPSVEYITAIELPCGCREPQCGCRTPAVKLPACRGEYFKTIEVPSCGCPSLQIPSVPASYGAIASVIELPSYPPLRPACGCQGPCSCPSSLACGCHGPCTCTGIPVSSCGCKGPCSCPEYQILPCGCQSSCACPEYQILTCGCQDSCTCPEYQILPCGCQNSCACPEYQILSCGCQGSCACPEYQILTCGCQGSCGCPEYQILSCGCQGSCSCPRHPPPCGCTGPCGCSGIPVSCGCQGPCSCPTIQAAVGLLPSVEVPSYGCGCNLSGCDCSKHLRQVTLQPPFL